MTAPKSSVVFEALLANERDFYSGAAFAGVPSLQLMISGAQQALYTVARKLRDEDIQRVLDLKPPKHAALVQWIEAEVRAMLDADRAREASEARRR